MLRVVVHPGADTRWCHPEPPLLVLRPHGPLAAAKDPSFALGTHVTRAGPEIAAAPPKKLLRPSLTITPRYEIANRISTQRTRGTRGMLRRAPRFLSGPSGPLVPLC